MSIKDVKEELKAIEPDPTLWFKKEPYDDNTIQQKFLDQLEIIEHKFTNEDYADKLSEALYLSVFGEKYDCDQASDEVKSIMDSIEIIEANNTCNYSYVVDFEWITFRFKEDEYDKSDSYITAISMYKYGDYRGAGYSSYLFVDGGLEEIYESVDSIVIGSQVSNTFEDNMFISQDLFMECGIVYYDYEGESNEIYIDDFNPNIPAKVRALSNFVFDNHMDDTRYHRTDYILKEIGPFVFIILDNELVHVYFDKTKHPKFKEDICSIPSLDYKEIMQVDDICDDFKRFEFEAKEILENDFEMLKYDEEEMIAFRELKDNFIELIKFDFTNTSYEIIQTTIQDDSINDELKKSIQQIHLQNVTNELPNMY